MENFAIKLKELSKGQKLAGNIVFFVGCGALFVFLLFCVFSTRISAWRALLPSLMGACAFILTVVGFLQLNTVLMWSGLFFATMATILFLHVFDAWHLKYSYPMFFASFAIASFITLPFSFAKKMHCFVLAMFGCIALLFFANSLWKFNIWATLVCSLGFIIVYAFFVWGYLKLEKLYFSAKH